MGDPWEGAPTPASVRAREARGDAWASASPAYAKHYQQQRKQVHISCWNVAEVESAAMWSLYAGKGIALRTTYNRLVSSLDSEIECYAGVVRYVDFEETVFQDDNVYWPLVHKRRSFEHEQELRVLTRTWGSDEYTMPDGRPLADITYVPPAIRPIPVNLQQLLTGVSVAPTAEAWFAALVAAVLSRYGLSQIPSRQSDLYSHAVF